MIDSDNKPAPTIDYSGQATIAFTAVIATLITELVRTGAVERDVLVKQLLDTRKHVVRHGDFTAHIMDAMVEAAKSAPGGLNG